MIAKQLNAWRKLLGLNGTQAADALGCHRNALAGWEAGRHPIPKYIELACMYLATKWRNEEEPMAGKVDITGKNGMEATTIINDDGKPVVRVEVFLDGKFTSWVEYDLAQLDNMIAVLQGRRVQLADLTLKMKD